MITYRATLTNGDTIEAATPVAVQLRVMMMEGAGLIPCQRWLHVVADHTAPARRETERHAVDFAAWMAENDQAVPA